MSGALSKRQQARNERTLQDLIKTIPGNNVCADCQARNPGWASWSLGIFLCMRCAALHRKLGTHITKVKSLSMDSWSNDQVETMRRLGNVASNRIYNPQNAKPPIPFDVDEADSAMERFIRQKYQNGTIGAPIRHNSGSTNSDDHPPPLPPKTGSRFGFRSASSIFPLSSKARRESERPEIESRRDRSPSPPRKSRINKQSKVLGELVGPQQSFDTKLDKLRDMGFRDEKRNTAVLRGLSGNLEKSIETLVRLGEGSGSATVIARSEDTSGSRTPISPTSGITIDRTRQRSPQKTSTNPFDMLDLPPTPAQSQSSQSTGNIGQAPNQMLGNNPYQQSPNSNPFGLVPSQSQYSLNQSFQNLAVSSSQPLFPNHTGGFAGPQHPQHQQLYQQSMTPPVPSVPQQHYPPVIYENSAHHGDQPNPGYNPFMQQQIRQAPVINTSFQSNPYAQQLLATSQSLYQSPLTQSPQYPAAYYDNETPPQLQQRNPFLNQDNPQPPNPQGSYYMQPQQQTQAQPQYQQQAQYQQLQSQPMMPQQTGRADKRSILDLYNYPQMAPQLPQSQTNQNHSQESSVRQGQAFSQPQRSMSSPLASHSAGSRNPFLSSGDRGTQNPGEDSVGAMGQFAPKMQGARHQSQESVSIDAGAWNTGRHSPDAWGTISARSVR